MSGVVQPINGSRGQGKQSKDPVMTEKERPMGQDDNREGES